MILTIIVSLLTGISVGGIITALLHSKIAIQYNMLFAIIGALMGGFTVYSLSPLIYAWVLELFIALFGAVAFSLVANFLPKE